MRIIGTVTSLLFLMVLAACDDSTSTTATTTTTKKNTTAPSALSPAGSSRDWLTIDNLNSSEYPHFSPIHNDYFMPIGETNGPEHSFSGTIEVNSGRIIGDFIEYPIFGDESFKNFPAVNLSFVSENGILIPLNRDRQVSLTDNSFWGIILEPGRVWSEPGDAGWSRASFPFTFISARRNQGHNGLATFLYNDSQISHLRIQIVQETTLWFKKDMYAQLSALYQPKQFPEAQSIVTAYQQEVDNTVTIRDWSELEFIGSNIELQKFNSQLKNSDINQAGLIKEGIVYLQPCYTRYGNYPYCRWMRNGAYSITKSLGAAFSMFRLAEVYGESIFELKIADYLNVTSNHNGWDEVTFGDVLNMAAGIGDYGAVINSGDIFADESKPKMERWIVKNSELEKLNISFSYGNYSWGPGVEFRYNSALTFILAAALDKYYKSVAGEDAHLWQMIVDDVYRPIGIQHVPMLETNEQDEQRGIAELLHGLYLNVDDIAKLSALIQNDGVHNGVQLLHRNKLREALFKTDQQGLRSWWSDNEFGLSRYLHGFWSFPFGDQMNCSIQIPYMSGYGGNLLVIMPNGTAAFRFTDAESYSPYNMIKATNKEKAVCSVQ